MEVVILFGGMLVAGLLWGVWVDYIWPNFPLYHWWRRHEDRIYTVIAWAAIIAFFWIAIATGPHGPTGWD